MALVVAVFTALLLCFSMLPVAAAAPGLLGPLYWSNPGGTGHPQPRTASANSASSSSDPGLLGPMTWTNPAPQGQHSQPATRSAANPGLMGPFYWQNEGGNSRTDVRSASPQSQTASNAYGQSVGLMGPLQWRNQAATPPTVAGANFASSAPAAPSPYLLTQSEELAPPPADGAPVVTPIPSSSNFAAEVVPPPTSGATGDKSLSGAESLGEEPADNSLQFLRTATVLLEPGEMQCDVGLQYQLIENDFTVVDSGTNQLVEATIKQRQLVVPLEIRYGLTRRAQFFIGAPVGWAHNEFSTETFIDEESDGGIGDISTGVSFLLCDGQGTSTDTIFTVSATLPTGDDSFTSAVLSQAAPALGSGFWAISTDLLWINSYDPVVVFYGVGWRHQFERDFFGVDVRPGNEYRAQLGVGFAVNQNITLSTRFNASFVTKTQLNGQSVDGSLLEPMTIRFAATIAKCNCLVEPFADIGTTDDAASSRFGVTWTY